MTSSVEECAPRARSTHGVHHTIVEINIVIGVVLGEVLVASVVPLVVDAVIGLTLGLIAHVIIVVFVAAIFNRIFQQGRRTLYSHRTRETVAVEPSQCPGTFQDLAESGPLGPEAAPVSSLHIRVERMLKFWSISVSRVAKSPSVFVMCESIRDIQFAQQGICTICGTNFERRASSFSSIVLPERVPIPSKSEPRPSGKPKLDKSELHG